MDGAYPPQ